MYIIICLIFDYLDLKTKYIISRTSHEYFKLFNNYKRNNLLISSNVRLLKKVFNHWKHSKKDIKINNSWIPKNKPFNREILLF